MHSNQNASNKSLQSTASSRAVNSHMTRTFNPQSFALPHVAPELRFVRRMTRIVACIAVIFFALAALAGQPAAKVSVRQLLEHPEKFVGKRVDVSGYCHTSNEEISLSASKPADERRHDCDSSVWLDIFTSQPKNTAKDKNLSFKTVRVIGTFRYQPNPILDKSVPYEQRYRGFGSYKMWAREITNITYLQPAR